MALKKCKECGAEISSSAEVCPKCGKELRASVGQVILGIFIAFIGIILIASAFSGTNNNNNSNTEGIAITSDGLKTIKSNDFTIIDDKTTGKRSNDGTYTVKGQLKQNVEGSYTGLMLTLNLLDKNNNKVRETSGLIASNYIGNNIWEFEVTGNDADGVVTGYEINSCYGY